MNALDVTEPGPTSTTVSRQVLRRRRWGWLLLGAVGLLVVLLLTTAVQGLRLKRAADDLERDLRATQHALGARADEGEFDPGPTRRAVLRVQQDARRMGAISGSWSWRLTEALPGLGGPLGAVGHVARAADTVARGVLPVLVDTAVDLRRGHRSGTLDVRAVTSRSAAVQAADRLLTATLAGLEHDDLSDPTIRRLHRQVTARLDRLHTAVGALAVVADIGGAMTGQDGERRYLVLLETPAEGRGTGGLAGGFLVVAVRNGAVRVVRTGTNEELDNNGPDLPEVGNGFDETWGAYGARRAWFSANLTLHYPSAARVWQALYDRQFGAHLDGVVGVTPEGLGRLLAITGPQQVPGGTMLTAENAAHVLEVGIYETFPRFNQDKVRNAYQLGILHALVGGVLHPQTLDPRSLASLASGVTEGSLRLESSHPREQARLETTALSGSVPETNPFIAWTTQNLAGDKLDVYLTRHYTYRRRLLPDGRVEVVATAVVINHAPPSGLPEYVTRRNDLPPGDRSASPVGSDKILVATYLSSGARVVSVTRDGAAAPLRSGQERGHPVTLVEAVVPPAGGTVTVVVTAVEPARPGPVVTVRQLVPRQPVYDLG